MPEKEMDLYDPSQVPPDQLVWLFQKALQAAQPQSELYVDIPGVTLTPSETVEHLKNAILARLDKVPRPRPQRFGRGSHVPGSGI
jgi:hypothetical protein